MNNGLYLVYATYSMQSRYLVLVIIRSSKSLIIQHELEANASDAAWCLQEAKKLAKMTDLPYLPIQV